MTVTSEDNLMSAETSQRYQTLTDRFLLISPTLGWWRAQYKLRDSVVTVGGQVVRSDAVTKGQYKLLEATDRTKAWRKRFQDLDTERGTLVENNSTPLPALHGVRIIPRTAAREFFDLLVGPVQPGTTIPIEDPNRSEQSIAYRLKLAGDEFIANYYEILNDIRENVEDFVWRRVVDRIPTAEKIHEKFHLSITPIEIAGGGDNPLHRTTRTELDTMDRFIQESRERLVHQAIEALVAGPRQTLADRLKDLQELIARDGRVTVKSFRPVREAIEKLRMFSCVANDDLLDQIRRFEQRMDITTPGTLDNVTATNSGFNSAIEAVYEEAVSAVARSRDIEEFGRPLRGLVV